MKNTMVVVADLGCLKAYRLENDEANRTPRLQLLEHYHSAEAHSKLVDKVTDSSGRFPRGAGSNGGNAMSDGERHNIELETRKRLVRQLAQRFNALARGKDVERCLVAASREINHLLLDELDPQVRGKIALNLSADLTKVGPGKLLRHF